MNIEPMLFCLLLGCLVTLLTLPLLLLSGWKGVILADLQRRNGVAASPTSDSPVVSKWGAVPLVVSFLAVSLLACLMFPDSKADSRHGWTILLTGLAMFGIGVWDDLKPLGTRRRLILQALMASLACFQGVQWEALPLPLASIGLPLHQWTGFATLGWLLLLIVLFQRINSMNHLAGIAGLAGMAVIARGAMGNSFSGLCAVGIAGALVAFLVYNLPPSRVRLGTSGAGFLGYLVGVLSVSNSHPDGDTSVLAILLIAIVAASLATWRGALKLLPTFPIRPKPESRPSPSRITSVRPRVRR